jgi:hypothetical protein
MTESYDERLYPEEKVQLTDCTLSNLMTLCRMNVLSNAQLKLLLRESLAAEMAREISRANPIQISL